MVNKSYSICRLALECYIFSSLTLDVGYLSDLLGLRSCLSIEESFAVDLDGVESSYVRKVAVNVSIHIGESGSIITFTHYLEDNVSVSLIHRNYI